MKYLDWIVVGVLLAGCDLCFGQNETKSDPSANGTAGNLNNTGLNSFALNLVAVNSTLAPVVTTDVPENPANASTVDTTPASATSIVSTAPPTSIPPQSTNTTATPSPAPSNSTTDPVPPQNSTVPANFTEKATIFPPEYTPATGWGSFLIAFGIVVIAGLVMSAFYFKSNKRGSRNEFSPLLSELESDM